MMTRSEDAKSLPGTWGRIRTFLVLGILTLVATVQLAVVEYRGMTRWKGGGFGMYSEPHYHQNQIWLGGMGPDGITYSLIEPLAQGPQLRERLIACKRRPTQACLRELRPVLRNRGLRAIQIWRPHLDPDTLEFQRELLAEIEN
jgi:hypothetical protein